MVSLVKKNERRLLHDLTNDRQYKHGQSNFGRKTPLIKKGGQDLDENQ